MNNYEKKIQKMTQHLQEHPTDYQTVISLFKIESEAIVYEQKKSKAAVLKAIASYRKVGEQHGK